MTEVKFYGHGLPNVENLSLPGKLIVLEGPDGVGRSTQVALLREWLEAQGYAVFTSGLRRSELASAGIEAAKQGHTLGHITMALFYAADFCDRMEREIIPMLRAGFVVLTDRYIYSLMARYMVRGVDRCWLQSLMGIALVPDAVFYLKTTVQALVPRVLSTRGFDYWEAGMDFLPSSDYYQSYVDYQQRMLHMFDELSAEFGFSVVDASGSIDAVFADLRDGIGKIVAELKARPV
ncbi:MAG: thymidylate kinase [Chloroflexi bacterium]|jgi:dTMP kinase|nr:thymidylate kinase [Chloroflexota bacterium]